MNIKTLCSRKAQALRRVLGTLLLLCVLIPLHASASDRKEASYVNPDTGYAVLINDGADLLEPDDEQALAASMIPITKYGNVAFQSILENYTSASTFAEYSYHEIFGDSSGLLFLVDMDNRYLYMYSDGEIYRTITSTEMETITDNTYSYASNGNYYQAAFVAFSQALALLEGRDIPRPMKYISNAVFSLMLGMLICFFFVSFTSRLKGSSGREMLKSAKKNVVVMPADEKYVRESRKYSPVSSSSSGGSSHSGGSRSSGGSHHSSGGSHHSSGGSHHSGGGGGHRF